MTAGNLRIEFQQELANVIKKNIDAAGKELEKEILKMMWDRTSQGVDIKGRRWRRYKAKGYDKKKKAYGRGKDDWLVLTGDLKAQLKVKYSGYKMSGKSVIMTWDVIIPSSLEKQVTGLLDTTGYDRNRAPYPKSDYQFIGIAESGQTYSHEQRVITGVLKKKLDID